MTASDDVPLPRERRIRVQRSARWFELGDAGPGVRDLWLVLHGYGQLARNFIGQFAPLAAQGRFVIAPEALSRFYHPGERPEAVHHMRAGASWMTREDRDAEILDYVDYLDAVVMRAQAEAPNAERLVVLGFSQGAATAARWSVLGRQRPDRLILWAGTPARDLPPGRVRERLDGLPVDVVHGTADRLIPLASAESAAGWLREQGARVAFRSFDGGHRIDAVTLGAVAGEAA